MFDISFAQILVIALVALIVIGPERLPRVARAIGLMLGRVRRYANDFKQEINREIELDELKRIQEDVASSARNLEASLRAEMKATEDVFADTLEEARAALPTEATPAETTKPEDPARVSAA